MNVDLSFKPADNRNPKVLTPAQGDGRDAYAINGYHTRCEGIHAMATRSAILDLVEDLVGPNIIAWGTHFFCKMPCRVVTTIPVGQEPPPPTIFQKNKANFLLSLQYS